MDACPTGAITMADGRALIDAVLCRQCEACISVCPHDALVFTGSALTIPTAGTVTLPDQSIGPVVQRPGLLARAVPLAAAVVGVVGREILPAVIDRLAASAIAPDTQRSASGNTESPTPNTVARRRRRHRGGRA